MVTQIRRNLFALSQKSLQLREPVRHKETLRQDLDSAVSKAVDELESTAVNALQKAELKVEKFESGEKKRLLEMQAALVKLSQEYHTLKQLSSNAKSTEVS